MGGFVMLSLATRVTAQLERSAGMGGFVMLSLATERLDSLRGVLVWEVLLCYHLQQSGCTFERSAGMGRFVQSVCDLAYSG